VDKRNHFTENEPSLSVETPVAPEFANTPNAQLASQNTTTSSDQVEDQDDQREHQKEMNQAASDVKAEAQKPQNQNDHKNCPKHIHLHPCIAGS
jgi:hypothetical protein